MLRHGILAIFIYIVKNPMKYNDVNVKLSSLMNRVLNEVLFRT